MTISAADANSAATGIEQAAMTGTVKLASFDMDGAGLDRIKAGTQLFAVDQQPWLPGFLVVSIADAYVSFGAAIASAPVLTGPGIVDAASVDATIAGAAADFRQARPAWPGGDPSGRAGLSRLSGGTQHVGPRRTFFPRQFVAPARDRVVSRSGGGIPVLYGFWRQQLCLGHRGGELAECCGLAGIIAIPIGLLMIAGELDISIGSLNPVGSMTMAILAGYFHLPVVLGIAAALIFGFVLHYTRFGNWILAMGGDRVSAGNAGIPTERMTISLFMCSGTSVTLVGLSQAILYNSAQVSAGQSYIFNAIISVVVGGVLLIGGYGLVVGIVLGTQTFAFVNRGIYYTAFDANWASLIIGVLLLVAVLMNNTFRKIALAYDPAKGKLHK